MGSQQLSFSVIQRGCPLDVCLHSVAHEQVRGCRTESAARGGSTLWLSRAARGLASGCPAARRSTALSPPPAPTRRPPRHPAPAPARAQRFLYARTVRHLRTAESTYTRTLGYSLLICGTIVLASLVQVGGPVGATAAAAVGWHGRGRRPAAASCQRMHLVGCRPTAHVCVLLTPAALLCPTQVLGVRMMFKHGRRHGGLII